MSRPCHARTQRVARRWAPFGALCLGVITAACRDDGAPGSGPAASPPADTHAGPAAGPPALVTMDAGRITADDFRAARADLPPPLRVRMTGAAGADELLQSLISKSLLVAEAERRKLHEKPDVATSLRRHRERTLIQALLADETKDAAPVEEAEIRKTYEDRPTRYVNEKGNLLEYDEVRERIRQEIVVLREKRAYDDLIAELRAVANAKIDPDALAALVAETAPQAPLPTAGALNAAPLVTPLATPAPNAPQPRR